MMLRKQSFVEAIPMEIGKNHGSHLTQTVQSASIGTMKEHGQALELVTMPLLPVK